MFLSPILFLLLLLFLLRGTHAVLQQSPSQDPRACISINWRAVEPGIAKNLLKPRSIDFYAQLAEPRVLFGKLPTVEHSLFLCSINLFNMNVCAICQTNGMAARHAMQCTDRKKKIQIADRKYTVSRGYISFPFLYWRAGSLGGCASRKGGGGAISVIMGSQWVPQIDACFPVSIAQDLCPSLLRIFVCGRPCTLQHHCNSGLSSPGGKKRGTTRGSKTRSFLTTPFLMIECCMAFVCPSIPSL